MLNICIMHNVLLFFFWLSISKHAHFFEGESKSVIEYLRNCTINGNCDVDKPKRKFNCSLKPLYKNAPLHISLDNDVDGDVCMFFSSYSLFMLLFLAFRQALAESINAPVTVFPLTDWLAFSRFAATNTFQWKLFSFIQNQWIKKHTHWSRHVQWKW